MSLQSDAAIPASPRLDAKPRRSVAGFILFTLLLDSMGLGLITPVVPKIIMSLGHTDLSNATRVGGGLTLVYAVMQLLAGPLIGNLGDRFGRRVVLLGALAGLACDYLMLSFAPNLAWLFVGRALAGVFGATAGPAGAALADISTPQDRAHYFGLMGAAYGVGFVLGPTLGGLLGEFGARTPFYAAAVLSTFNLVFGLFVFPETLAAHNRRPIEWARANPLGAWRSLGRLQGVRRMLIANFFWQLAGMIYPVSWAYFTIAAFGWSPGKIGLSLALCGLLMSTTQVLVVRRVVRRIGESRTVTTGICSGIVQFVSFAIIHEGWMAFASLALFMPLQSFAGPVFIAMMSRQVEANAQGELQGFNGSTAAFAAIVAPVLYTPVIAWFISPAAPFRLPGAGFLLAAAAALIALVLLVRAHDADQRAAPVPA